MEKTIKHRLFTWFENVDNPVDPNGGQVRVERIAHLGSTVDITDEASLARGEELDAFYSDEEAEAIANGTFRGPTAEAVYRSRAGVRLAQIDEEEAAPAELGDLDVYEASSEQIGEFIAENNLTVPKTISLVPDDADEDLIQKFYDAEIYASDNDPRVGVTNALDARLAALASS